MDLSAVDTLALSEEGAIMTVRGPGGGAPLEGVTITVAGAESERVKRVQRAAWNLRSRMGGRRSIMPTAEEAESDALDTTIAATLGWAGIELDGKVLEFSKDNARAIYTRFPWLRRQVEAFRDDEANFIKASTKG